MPNLTEATLAEQAPELKIALIQTQLAWHDREANLEHFDTLLEQAGWVLKGQQRVNSVSGKPLSFELLLPAGSNSQWVLPFQHNLQRLGITMNIRQVDNSQATNRMRNRDYDMMPRLWRAMPWPATRM